MSFIFQHKASNHMTENRVTEFPSVSRRQMLQGMSLAAASALFRNDLHASLFDEDPDRSAFSKVLAFVDDGINAKTFPGAALTVTRHRKVVLEKYWGTYCSREQRNVT